MGNYEAKEVWAFPLKHQYLLLSKTSLPTAQQALVDQGLRIIEASRSHSHSDTHTHTHTLSRTPLKR
jgi:predicted glycoside hydrolase/deacetylase ChbG (UPF0249 family)